MEQVISRPISTDKVFDKEDKKMEAKVGQDFCPDCSNVIFQGSGCAVCLCCGYSPCG